VGQNTRMRLFTAIDIPDDVKKNLRELLHRLQPLSKLSWSSVDKLHITTKFIGEWPEERLEELKHTLSSVGSPGLIDIAVRGLEWFPRALVAGVAGGEQLKSLAAATEEAAAPLGIPVEDRVYSPHLTLARIRDRKPLSALRQAVAAADTDDFGSFRAYAFYLYLSSGGKYTKLAEFTLV
jgi:2'-5' RNA ligase